MAASGPLMAITQAVPVAAPHMGFAVTQAVPVAAPQKGYAVNQNVSMAAQPYAAPPAAAPMNGPVCPRDPTVEELNRQLQILESMLQKHTNSQKSNSFVPCQSY